MLDRTKMLKKRTRIFFLISALLTVGPIIGFLAYAIFTGHVNKAGTYGFGVLGITAAFMALISAISKAHWRSPTYIVLLALIFVLDSLVAPILIIGICTFLDEAVFSPLYKHYKNEYTIGKEIEKYRE